MCDEKDILLDIYDALLIDIITFKNAKTRMEKIKTRMTLLNNNFFTINCNDPLFTAYIHTNEDAYNTTMLNLITLQSQLKRLITTNNCYHEWITDTIDIDPDTSKEICYCVKCEMSKS